MTRFPLAVICVIGLCFGEVSCVAVTVGQTNKGVVMRSEKSDSDEKTGQDSMELHASGAVMDTNDDNFHGDYSIEVDMCNVDFPMGVADTCECSDPKNHELILIEEECMEAATQAGTITPYNFRVEDDAEQWPHKRPKGCFKAPCEQSPKGVCYFFNPIGIWPAKCGGTKLPDGSVPNIQGTPVCRRAKYLNGTVNGNGGCPRDYGVIMDEDNCSEAAVCLGYCEGRPQFRVTAENQSRHDDFPLGCFIDHEGDGCVYWNPPLENWLPPKDPHGTPICNVTVRTWINLGDHDVVAPGSIDTHNGTAADAPAPALAQKASADAGKSE